MKVFIFSFLMIFSTLSLASEQPLASVIPSQSLVNVQVGAAKSFNIYTAFHRECHRGPNGGRICHSWHT